MTNDVNLPTTAGADFALHCRGDVRLYRGDLDRTPKSKKGRALLAVLAAEQRPLTRVKIVDLLWSDRQEEQARASLRTLIADLKEQLGAGFDQLLMVDRERVGLCPGVRTDLTDPTLARPHGELFEGLDHIDPQLDEWLRAEREKWSGLAKSVRPKLAETEDPTRRTKNWQIATALMFATALLALLYLRPWAPAHRAAVLAVMPFKDATGANPTLALGLAEQLRTELVQNPKIGLIGRSSSEAKELNGKPATDVAKLLDATHIVEGSVVPHDGQTQVAIRLLDGKSGKVIWSTHVEASGSRIVDARYSMMPALAEYVGTIADRPKRDAAFEADPETWARFFEAQSKVRDNVKDLKQAYASMTELLSLNPNFVPALTAMPHLIIALSDHPQQGMGDRPLREARLEARIYAKRALAAAPDYGPAYSAMGETYLEMDEELAYLQRAAQLNPGRYDAHAKLAYALRRVGRWKESTNEARIAARLNPLQISSQWNLVEALGYAGREREAKESMRKYFALGIPATDRWSMTSVAETFLFGDYSLALLAANQEARVGGRNPRTDAELLIPTIRLFGPKAALQYVRPSSISYHVLNDDVAGTKKALMAAGPEFWRMFGEVTGVAHYLFSKGEGQALISVYDMAVRQGRPATETEFLNSDLIFALRAAGRYREASALIGAFRRYAFKADTPPAYIAINKATVAALEGRNSVAIAELEKAQRWRWWLSMSLYEHPFNATEFRALRSNPRFQKLVENYDFMIARERKEAVQEMRAAEFRIPQTIPTSPVS